MPKYYIADNFECHIGCPPGKPCYNNLNKCHEALKGAPIQMFSPNTNTPKLQEPTPTYGKASHPSHPIMSVGGSKAKRRRRNIKNSRHNTTKRKTTKRKTTKRKTTKRKTTKRKTTKRKTTKRNKRPKQR